MLSFFSVLLPVSTSYLYYLAVRALRARPHLTFCSPTLSSSMPSQQSSPAQVCSVCQVGKKKKLPCCFHPWDSWGWAGFSPSETSLRTGRPVRCMLDRDEDMLITGGRHPFLARYKVSGACQGGQYHLIRRSRDVLDFFFMAIEVQRRNINERSSNRTTAT